MLLFLRRRVFAIVIHILMVGLGFIGLSRLQVREYPKMSEPNISIEIEYPGASPRSVKREVAMPLVDAITSLSGLDKSEIHINQGLLRAYLKFKNDVASDNALVRVISKVDGILNQLPRGLRKPIIRQSDDSSSGTINLVITPSKYQDAYTSSGLAEVLAQYVKNFIESVPGVASVLVPGAAGSELRSMSIDVFLKPEAMAAYKITPYDVFRAIGEENRVEPAGEFKIGPMFFNAQFNGSLHTIEEFGNIIIKDKVRVKDIAKLEINGEKENFRFRYNGQICALAYVKLQPNANIIEVSKEVRSKLGSIQEIIPDTNLKLVIASDDSLPIKESIDRVYWTILEAIIIVAIIVIFFLRTWRFAVISLIAIPICITTGFFILYVFGFTINMLTLFAIVLAIGLVVDDAIIVCERIEAKIREGFSVMEACNKGIEEIQFSILAMTFTLVSVYAPIAFAKGILGKLFIEFAVLLAGTVVISGIVAYILTPVMCSFMLSNDEHQDVSVVPIKSLNEIAKKPVIWFNTVIDQIENLYRNTLKIAIRNRFVVFWVSVIIFLMSLVCAKGVRVTTSPHQDKNSAAVRFQLPPKTDIKSINALMQKIEAVIGKNPYVKGYFTEASQNENIRINVELTDLSKRDKTDKDIAREIREEIEKEYAYGRIATSYGSYSPFSKDNSEFSVELRSDLGSDQILKILPKLTSRIGDLGYGGSIRYTRLDPQRSYAIIVDRERAYEHGINFNELTTTINNIMMGNPPASRYVVDGARRTIQVKTTESDRNNLDILNNFLIRSSKPNEERDDRELVPLSSFAKVVSSYEMQTITMNNGLETCIISWDLDPKIDRVKAYNDVKQISKEVLPPKGFVIEPSDDLRRTIEEKNTFYFIFAVAVVFVYLFMAALFESFLSPFIVLFTIPLAISGALFSIWIAKWASFNIWTYVGIFTLLGLITKNGILLVDFFNKERETEANVFKCALRSGVIRFRPIVMTTVAMVASSITLVSGHGIGYELMREIGLVVASGLSFGTVLTLYLIPCLCVIFEHDFKNTATLRKSNESEEDTASENASS